MNQLSCVWKKNVNNEAEVQEVNIEKCRKGQQPQKKGKPHKNGLNSQLMTQQNNFKGKP